jgi:hypothetical protein
MRPGLNLAHAEPDFEVSSRWQSGLDPVAAVWSEIGPGRTLATQDVYQGKWQS